MKRLIFALLTMSMFAISPYAHAEHSLGFAAGVTRGIGATYRNLPNPDEDRSLGWQVTGLPVVTNEEGTVSVGATALYLLHRGDVALAYASFGAGYLARWENCTDPQDFQCEEKSHWGLGVGPGVGFELRVVSNFAWAVDVPIAVIVADSEFHGIYPVPNSSLVYYW